MASPQKENGYTAISHELLLAYARIDIPSEARRCLFVVLRQIYGYVGKKSDRISQSQFVLMTCLNERQVRRGISWLVKTNLIFRDSTSGGNYENISSFSINKNYDSWIIPNRGDKLVPGDNPVLAGGTNPRIAGGTNPRIAGGTIQSPTKQKQKQIISRARENKKINNISLKEEIEAFKQIGWDTDKIKHHFLNTREIPEASIDIALNKNF